MPELALDGETFRCKPKLPAGPLLKLAKSQSGNEIAQLAGMLDFVTAILADAERERFSTFLDTSEADFEEWNAAVGTLMESYTDRPTRQPSLSPPGLSTAGGSSTPEQPSEVRNLSTGRRAAS